MQRIWGFVKRCANSDDLLAWVTAGLLFLLPWQTRLILGFVPLAGAETSFGILSIHVLEVLVMLVGLWGVYLYRGEIVRNFSGLWWPIFMFSGLILLNAGLSIHPLLSWHHLFHLDAANALFVLIALQRAYVKRFVFAFATGLIVPIFLGAYQFMIGFSPASTVFGIAERLAQRSGDSVILFQGERILRGYGSFSHPNIFGGYLSIALLLLVGYWRAWSVGQKKVAAVLIFILSIGLVLTFSKSAMLGLLVGLSCGLLVQTRVGANGWRKWGSTFTAVMAAASISAFFLIPRFSQNSLEIHSMNERLVQWETLPQLLAWFSPAQWIFGTGGGVYPFLWQSFDATLEWWLYQPIHNVFALVFAEMGLLGFAAFLWFVYVIDQKNFSALPRTDAVAALMAGASLFTIALFDHYLWTFWSGLSLGALVLGLTWVSGSVQKDMK